ncbi:hypothetical protein AAHE18_08G124700 [Arachis hypogaea]
MICIDGTTSIHHRFSEKIAKILTNMRPQVIIIFYPLPIRTPELEDSISAPSYHSSHMEVTSVAIPFHYPVFPGFLQPKSMLFLQDSFQFFTQLRFQIIKVVTFTISERILNALESGKNLLFCWKICPNTW